MLIIRRETPTVRLRTHVRATDRSRSVPTVAFMPTPTIVCANQHRNSLQNMVAKLREEITVTATDDFIYFFISVITHSASRWYDLL